MVLEIKFVDLSKLISVLNTCSESVRQCIYRALAVSNTDDRSSTSYSDFCSSHPCWIVLKSERRRTFIVFNPRQSRFFVVSEDSMARVENVDAAVREALNMVGGRVRRVLMYVPELSNCVKVRVVEEAELHRSVKTLLLACCAIASYVQTRVGSSPVRSSHSHHVEKYS